jgi:hypothetical protein
MATRRSATSATSTRVVLEVGRRLVFASALDWPGWSRSGKGEEAALANLADYAPRFAVVAHTAGLALPADAAEALEVVEHLTGSATTDFGAPAAVAAAERDRLTPAQAGRMADLVRASWAVLDDVAASSPPTLRKGPRGGGRDRDAIIEHVLAAETAYARKIGLRLPQPVADDDAGTEALRDAIEGALRAARGGAPSGTTGWPPRYAARRIAWHVLDHAWEIEDKRAP